MLKRIVKGVLLLAELVGLAAIAGILFFIWRLYNGPISIEGAIPYIAEAVNMDYADFHLNIEQAYLAYYSSSNPLTVRIVGLDVYDADGLRMASVPEALIDFSWVSILQGRLSPKRITIPSPSLKLRVAEDGSISGYARDKEQKEGEGFDIVGLIRSFIHSDKEPYLEEIGIGKAEIQVSYGGSIIDCPEINVRIQREAAKGKVLIDGLIMVGIQGVNFDLTGDYDRNGKTLAINAELSPFNPNLAMLAAQHDFLDSVNMSVGIKASARLDLGLFNGFSDLSFVNAINFKASGYGGVIRLPFVDDKEIYKIKNAEVEGSFSAGLKRLDITDFSIKTNETAGNAAVIITGIDTLATTGSLKDIRMEVHARAPVLRAKELRKHWPQSIGPDVREWLYRNISGGTYRNASFKMIFNGTEAETIEPELVDGTVDFHNAKINYIDTMPMVENASGYGHVTLDRVDLFVKSGTTKGLKLTRGKLVFTEIRAPQEYAEIDLEVEGPVQDALKLINNKPFEYMKEMQLDPDDISGRAHAAINLSFPLDMNLSTDKVKAKIDADIKDAEMKNAFKNIHLTDADLDLKINNDLLVLSGKGRLQGIDTDIIFKKYFNNRKFPIYEYQLRTTLNPDMLNTYYPDYGFVNRYVTGNIPVQAFIQLDDNREGFIKMRADLINTALDFGIIGWSKESARASVLTLKTQIKNKQERIDFKISDRRLNRIAAHMDFDGQGKLSAVVFDEIKGARTDGYAAISFADNEIKGDIKAKALNMEGVFRNISNYREIKFSSAAAEDSAPPDVRLSLDIDSLSFGEKESYRNVKGDVLRENGIFENVNISASVGAEDTPAVFSLGEENGIQKFFLNSDDAGANLRVLGLIDNIKGGNLRMSGEINENGEVEGHILVKDFYFLNAPTLAKLLSLASFTGILDSLEGNGIQMKRFDVPYTFKDGTATVTDAYTYGSGFGLTGWGTIDVEGRNIHLNGSIVPAYTLNSLLGNIPLFGRLFSGEKGSGLFNFGYEIKGATDAPAITVNPLYVLAPGVIKTILNSAQE